MRVLVACEFSGVVRDAFIAKGHAAMSCDLLPSVSPGPHYQGDVIGVLGDGWDMMIAHPPCTYLSSSGLHWNNKRLGRFLKTEQALAFVRKLMDAPIPFICLENPVGCIGTRIRKPDQIINPYEFGEDASKRTCLWFKGLCHLYYTFRYPGRWVRWNGKLVERWSNQTDSGQNALPPSEARASERAVTYSGIASAMANQWTRCISSKTSRSWSHASIQTTGTV